MVQGYWKAKELSKSSDNLLNLNRMMVYSQDYFSHYDSHCPLYFALVAQLCSDRLTQRSKSMRLFDYDHSFSVHASITFDPCIYLK